MPCLCWHGMRGREKQLLLTVCAHVLWRGSLLPHFFSCLSAKWRAAHLPACSPCMAAHVAPCLMPAFLCLPSLPHSFSPSASTHCPPHLPHPHHPLDFSSGVFRHFHLEMTSLPQDKDGQGLPLLSFSLPFSVLLAWLSFPGRAEEGGRGWDSRLACHACIHVPAHFRPYTHAHTHFAFVPAFAFALLPCRTFQEEPHLPLSLSLSLLFLLFSFLSLISSLTCLNSIPSSLSS